MKIGSLNSQDRTIVMAEIGVNHEGRFEIAQRLVREAAACGVDAVKFQTFNTDLYVSRQDQVRYNRLKSFELSPAQFGQLADLAHSLKLLFISTPLDLDSIAVLEPLVDAYKVASGDNNFYPLLARIADTGKAVILSSGASDFEQVQETVRFIKECWAAKMLSPEWALLHCVSSYPVPAENANLRSIPFLQKHLDCTIGYSDHTQGEEAAVLSVAMGAQIIEKHFTLDHNFSDFRDHKISSDPSGMRQLVQRVRQVEKLLGTFNKTLQPCEIPIVPQIRRSVVAAADMNVGHRLTPADVTWKRSGTGLPPGQETRLLNKTLKRRVDSGEPILITDVE